MFLNSPVTVEVSNVIWKTWNLTRMDLGGGIHLTCLRALGPCSMLAEQYNRVRHDTTSSGSIGDNESVRSIFILRSLHSVTVLQQMVCTTGASTHGLHHADTLSLKVSFLLVELTSFDHTKS